MASFTVELKSAKSLSILPEIWLPTWTETTGLTVPVAVTTEVMGPRSTGAVCDGPVRCRRATDTTVRFRSGPENLHHREANPIVAFSGKAGASRQEWSARRLFLQGGG